MMISLLLIGKCIGKNLERILNATGYLHWSILLQPVVSRKLIPISFYLNVFMLSCRHTAHNHPFRMYIMTAGGRGCLPDLPLPRKGFHTLCSTSLSAMHYAHTMQLIEIKRGFGLLNTYEKCISLSFSSQTVHQLGEALHTKHFTNKTWASTVVMLLIYIALLKLRISFSFLLVAINWASAQLFCGQCGKKCF